MRKIRHALFAELEASVCANRGGLENLKPALQDKKQQG